MSRHEYETHKQILDQDPPFYALIMAAMHKADTSNSWRLRNAFPQVWDELEGRYNGPAGRLPSDPDWDQSAPASAQEDDDAHT